jgi:hypothetical protein
LPFNFNKGTKVTQWGKIFSANDAKITGYPNWGKLTSSPISHHTQKLIPDR